MVILAVGAAAAPVVCDPAEAQRILLEARIDERRVPVTHPWLAPGLARSAPDPAVAAAVAAVCAPGGELAVERGEQIVGAGWEAYVVVLSRIERDGCGLVQQRVPLSIGIGPAGTTYALRGALPTARTPVDPTCPDVAVWRQETVLAGEGERVRLVLVVDHHGDAIVGTRVAVRTATARGWSEQIVAQPAPPRLLDPTADGPVVELARTRDGDVWVVVSHDRATVDGTCRPIGGQTLWQPTDDGWRATTGREAATSLAREGAWRSTGEDGWLLILAQDDEGDLDLVEPRRRRLQRRYPEPLHLLASSDFPGLNPGFVVIAPGPWATELEAKAARRTWRRGATTYVKQAWAAVDPCRIAPPGEP
ncbi:MAG: hypothetical protein ABMB14_19760 [Myxococcota bacterium]